MHIIYSCVLVRVHLEVMCTGVVYSYPDYTSSFKTEGRELDNELSHRNLSAIYRIQLRKQMNAMKWTCEHDEMK